MTANTTRTFSIDTDAGLAECFDATAAAVFTALCHLTVGDRLLAPQLLGETFVIASSRAHAGSKSIDEQRLVILAHEVFLEHADAKRPAPSATESDWERSRWGEALDAIVELTPTQRVALNLNVVVGLAVAEVARCCSTTEPEAETLISSGMVALRSVGLGDSIPELFRHTELWLADLERERVRGSVLTRSVAGRTRSPEAVARLRHRLVNVGVAVVAVIAAGLIAWWALGGSDDTGKPVNLITPSSPSNATSVFEPQPTLPPSTLPSSTPPVASTGG